MVLGGPQFLLAGALALVAAGGVLAEEAKPVPGASTGTSAPSDTNSTLDAISTAIRGLLVGPERRKGLPDTSDETAVVEFYAARDFAPAWLPGGIMTDKVRALIARIQAADADDLNPSDFTLPSQDLGRYAKIQPQVAARADVMLSQAVAAYARQAYAGQVDPGTISGNIGYERRMPDLVAALNSVATSPEPVETLVAYNPPRPEFAALRERLAGLRRAEGTEKPRSKSRPERPSSSVSKMPVSGSCASASICRATDDRPLFMMRRSLRRSSHSRDRQG